MPVLLLLLFSMAADPAQEIEKLLSTQAAAWNRGDIPGFMQAYENSAETTYAGSSGVTKGYAKVLARYQKRYSTAAQMGMLVFSDLNVRMLGDTRAFATGRFRLQRAPEAGGPAEGWFTLILVKGANGWKIIHDHTS